MGRPDYLGWLTKIEVLVDNLKEYASEETYTDNILLELFFRVYRQALPADHLNYDELLNSYNEGKVTWDTLRNTRYAAAIQTFVADRTALAIAVSDDFAPTSSSSKKVMHAQPSYQTQSKSAPAPKTSQSKAPPPTTSSPSSHRAKSDAAATTAMKSAVLLWDSDGPCAIHCLKSTSSHNRHLNRDCNQQRKARLSYQQDPSHDLIAALEEIKRISDQKAQARKANDAKSASSAPPVTKSTSTYRPPRVASVAVVVNRRGDSPPQEDDILTQMDDDNSSRKRRHEDDSTISSYHVSSASRHESNTSSSLDFGDDDVPDDTSSEGSKHGLDYNPCEMTNAADEIHKPTPEECEAAYQKHIRKQKSNEARRERRAVERNFLRTSGVTIHVD